MAIYGVTIRGRNRRLLVKAESAAKAVGFFCEAKALTAEQMQDALDEGESVWKPGQPLPDDSPAPEPAPEAPAADDGDSNAPLDPPATEQAPAEGDQPTPTPPKGKSAN